VGRSVLETIVGGLREKKGKENTWKSGGGGEKTMIKSSKRKKNPSKRGESPGFQTKNREKKKGFLFRVERKGGKQCTCRHRPGKRRSISTEGDSLGKETSKGLD